MKKFGLILSFALILNLVWFANIATAETITLKVQSHGGATNAYRLGIERVIKVLEEKSGGRIKVNYYPADALVSYKEVFSAVSQGILDIGQQATTYNVGTLGGVAVFNHMAWNFDPSKFMKNYRKIGYYDYMNERFMKHNVRLMTNLVQPSGDFVWTDRHPVKVMEDLNGLIVAANTGIHPFLKLLGAKPLTVGSTDRYDALHRKIVDVINMGASIAVSSRYYEIADGITIVNISAGNNCHMMNLEKYNSLPDDLRKLVDNAFLETEKIHLANTEEAQKSDRKVLADAGMEIYVLPEAERERWFKATEEGYANIKQKYSKEWQEFGKMWPMLR
jgi:TRAP-type C4-dicarboxylate transport system substrate-binding protein